MYFELEIYGENSDLKNWVVKDNVLFLKQI